MNETKELVQKVTEGIQEKKGNRIVIADLTSSPKQSASILSSVRAIRPAKWQPLSIPSPRPPASVPAQNPLPSTD